MWSPLPKQLDRRNVNNFVKGLDTGNSPFFVDDNSLVSGYGWDFNQYPALSVRDGRTAYGSAGTGTTRLLANFGSTHLVRAVGTALSYNSSGTTWTAIAGSYADTDWSASNFDVSGPALLLLNSTDGGYYWDGSALTAIAAMPHGKYITTDNLRAYVAGVSGTLDVVYFSAQLDATDWTTPENSGFIEYYTPSGGPITALHAYNGQVWCFKSDSFAILYNGGPDVYSFNLLPISDNIGCVAYRTVLEVGPYLFWLGRDNVYIGAGDQAREIGHEVRAYLDTINTSAVANSFAFGTNQRYYLCIPTGSNTDPDTCLVYDYTYKKWLPYSITLGGIRWGAQLNGVSYGGNGSGQIYKLNDGTTDAGTAIPWRVQSRPFDDGIKEAEKELWEMHMQGYFPTGTTLTVEVAPDDIGSTWYNIDYDPTTASSATQNKNLIVPLDTVPLCNFYSYRISGTGPATIQEIQRYSHIMPVQY